MSAGRGKKLGTIFVELGVLTPEQERAALAFARKSALPFGQACVRLGLIDEATVVKGLSMQLGAPSVSLQGITVSPAVRALIPARLAEKERVVPVSVIPASGAGRGLPTLVIAIASPKNLVELDELSFITGHRISPVIASDSDIDGALMSVYGIDVHRRTSVGNVIDLVEAPSSLDELQSDVNVVDQAHTLAVDFLPTVEIDEPRARR